VPPARETVRFVTVGHVDHGKSTLIGRLLHDANALAEGKAEALARSSARRGREIEYAFALDALQAERDQGITIDSTQVWFRTPARDYVIIDAPGHREFLRNMLSGAAQADAALLVIDAEEGIREQTRRHAYLLHLLGVPQLTLVVNKMDRVDFSAARFAALVAEMTGILDAIGLRASHAVPVVARDGDNVVAASPRMPWHAGPTIVGALDSFQPAARPTHLPLRLPIQDVYKFDDRRIFAGRIDTGRLAVGDRLVFSPSNKTARIASIETWGGPAPDAAEAGRSVGITLDEPLFVERGEIASHEADAPIETTVFRATVFWLGERPLATGRSYVAKLATAQLPVTVQAITRIIDSATLDAQPAEVAGRNAVAEVVFRTPAPVALDEARSNPRTGRFVLIEDYDVVGGGLVSMEGYPDQRPGQVRSSNLTAVAHEVTAEARMRRNGHRGAVIWLTGLSGAGKSTLAMALEARLFSRGAQVYVLDGDNLRAGLNGDLGFSPEDRAENIRRVGEVAALMADAGLIVITAFISPYRADRDRARRAAKGGFHEIHVRAGLPTCEQRDPKGLYRRARRGEIAEFTGISSPYEAPERPELVVDTERQAVPESVDQLFAYLRDRVLTD